MPSYRSGLGFSASVSYSAQRYCYARASLLEQLLATPGAVELLLQELTGEPCPPGSVIEQLARLKRHAIHLSVTRTPVYGLSLEEIVVLCAYTSPHFEHSPFRHQLLAEPSAAVLTDLCRTWLFQRASQVCSGEELGAGHWPLIGHTPREPSDDVGGDPGSLFTIAVAPISHSTLLDRELPALGAESGFAHEHYLACTPATALDYLRRTATLGTTVRWDPFALDRRLRSLGLGLLLVEGRDVTVYLPARYHPSRSGIFGS